MHRRGKRARSIHDERGAAYAEYVPLLAVIALVVMFGITLIVPWIQSHISEPAVVLDDGSCPPSYTLMSPTYNADAWAEYTARPGGTPRDLNGDEFLCFQVVPGGNGEGNTGKQYNIKDNSRPPGT